MARGKRRQCIDTRSLKVFCLFFVGSDYEGLPDLYSLIDGVLKDSDGEEIVTRVMIDDSSIERKGIDVCDAMDMTIDDDIPDHESEMYVGTGTKPDWIDDDLQTMLDNM